MSFAVRPIGLTGISGPSWTFVGAGSLSTSSTVNFPATAQAGDLAVFCASASGGTAPSGWSVIASASSLQRYKVCAGGETSASWGPYATPNACILLFRPVGGSASLYDGQTNGPAADRTMSAGAAPSVIVAIGNYPHAEASWSPTLPGTWTTEQSVTSASALYVAWRFMEPSESTGVMNLGFSGRQTFGIWGVS